MRATLIVHELHGIAIATRKGVDEREVNRASVIVTITVLLTWLAAPGSPAPADLPVVVPPSPFVTASPLIVPRPPDLTPEFDLREAEDESDNDEADGATDLFGNDVKTAIATYKVDNTGSLYELHSPHTEVPRLGIPKS